MLKVKQTGKQAGSTSIRIAHSTAGPRLGLTLVEVIAVILILGLPLALLAPATRSSRGAARRVQCKNNLKQIGLALHQYHDHYGIFPAAEVVGLDHQPCYSWRTQIHPPFDEENLGVRIDFSRSWNDPVNSDVLKACPAIYHCPNSNATLEKANYGAALGADTIFCQGRGRPASEVTDGTSNTLMVVELPDDNAVPWMAPLECDIKELFHRSGQKNSLHSGGWNVLLGDGSVRFLSEQTSQITLQALSTASAGDDPGEF